MSTSKKFRLSTNVYLQKTETFNKCLLPKLVRKKKKKKNVKKTKYVEAFFQKIKSLIKMSTLS
jgi:hypothetical protein